MNNVTTYNSRINVLIPMAGIGKRFSDSGYKLPKPLLSMGDGVTMIEAVYRNLYYFNFRFIFVVNNQQIDPKEIKRLVPGCDIVEVCETPQGPAMSCMCAEDLINNDTPLIMTNCDQIIRDFSFPHLKEFCEINKVDGAVGVFHSTSPKNSYVKIDDNNTIIEIKEKQVISNIATNGFHLWKKGTYFVDSVKQMVKAKDTVNDEYFVAPSFKYMIQRGMKVMPFWYNMHFPIGTPQDFEYYKNNINL